MDEGNGLTPSNGSFHWSIDTSAEHWHSTPVKKKHAVDGSQPSVLTSSKMDNNTPKHWAKGSPPIQTDSHCPPSSQHTESPASDLSSCTIARQRRELHLLMAELKDRDRELNASAAAHHRQLQAWEQDRQRALGLEHRGARLEEELQKRNDVIRVLTKRVWTVETREEEVKQQLSAARQTLSELQLTQQQLTQKTQDFEEQNVSLNSTVMALSTQVGSLQVREEELSSMLKLKDKDVTEASCHIADLASRLGDAESSLTETRSRENKLQRELEENKRRYKDARHELTYLKDEFQQQVTQSSTQREEIIRLKQELQLLRRDLALSGEGDGWKDELLELSRSKQERTMSELRCLRQVCENQRNDLQLLQLNMESSREVWREKTGQGLLPGSQEELRCSCVDNRSPSSVRVKNLRLSQEASAMLTAELQAKGQGDMGAFSAHSIDGEDPLSSCYLQQLLQETRRLSTDPVYSHKTCHASPPNHHPLPHHLSPQAYKACESPPRVCPRHCTSQTDVWTT